MAIHTDPGQDDYLYVANAYSGSVTPVNLQTLFDSLLDDYDVYDPPAHPEAPITTGVEGYIKVGPRTLVGGSWAPPYDHLITRAVAFYEDFNSQAWRLAASVSGYEETDKVLPDLPYPASMAKLDIDPGASDPESCGQGEPEFNCLLGHVVAAGETRPFGNFMVGLTPTRDYKRWVLVNEGGPPDQTRTNSLFFFDMAADYGVELPLGQGKISGSAALSYDGQRAYVARETGCLFEHTGVVVVDLRPWVLNSQRSIGHLGQCEGVSHVAVFSDPGNNVYKIYQSNVDDDIEDPKMGVWVMPEPLVLPFQPARLVSGLDVTGSYSERELVQRSYALQGPEIRADDTLGDKISMTIVPDANRDGALGGPDFDFGEIGTMDMEYGTDNGEPIIILKNETWLTNNDFQDLTPTWSPEPFGAESEYKIIFSSERKCDQPGCSPGYCPDACARAPEGQETRNLDLFVMDEDLDQVKKLDLPDTALYNEADADWGIDGVTGDWVVVFKREPNSACTECEPVSTLWKATYNTTTDTLSDLTQMTDPDIQLVSLHAPFGDYDPGIDEAGDNVVFIRHLDNSVIQGEPVGDYDVFTIGLRDPLGTPVKLTGECDGVGEEGGGCDPSFLSAEFTPVWSPDPGAPAAGPHIAFVVWSTNNEDHEDIFILDAGTVDPYKMDPGDPGEGIDSNIDTGPFWHPRSFGADPNYTGPNLLFDRKVLAAEEQAVYLEKLLMK